MVGKSGCQKNTITDTTSPLGPQTHKFKKGDPLLINLKAASRDPTIFPNPDTVDLTRPLDSYIHLGHGPHQCLGLPMTRVALTAMLKVIARLENLQAAPMALGGGADSSVASSVKKVVREFTPGDLARIPESWHYHAYLTEDWDMFFPLPTSEFFSSVWRWLWKRSANAMV